MPGWRLGVLAGRPDVVQAALQVKSNLDSGQYLPIQIGAAEALSTGSAWHEERNATLRAAARGRRGAASYTRLRTPWLGSPGSSSGRHYRRALAPQRLSPTKYWTGRACSFRPGTVFGPAGEGFVRLSLCASEDVLREAIALASRSQTAAA